MLGDWAMGAGCWVTRPWVLEVLGASARRVRGCSGCRSRHRGGGFPWVLRGARGFTRVHGAEGGAGGCSETPGGAHGHARVLGAHRVLTGCQGAVGLGTSTPECWGGTGGCTAACKSTRRMHGDSQGCSGCSRGCREVHMGAQGVQNSDQEHHTRVHGGSQGCTEYHKGA